MRTSPAEQIKTFFSTFQSFHFEAGELVLHSGKKTYWIYYLENGIVSQSSISPEGQETIITFYKPAAFFPLIWAVKDAPVPYEFRAVTPGNGWKAPKDEVINFLKTNAEVSFDLTTRLLSGLEGLGRKVEYALQANANVRISEALLTLAYRFGTGTRKEKTIELALTHQKLADITGLTRETITRELMILRKKGLIVVTEQTYVVPDLEKLAEVVGGLV